MTPHVTGRLEGAYRAGIPATGNRPGWSLSFEYDEEVIAALKAAIPAWDRSYDDETHEWWVAEKHEDAVLRLFPGFAAYLHQLSLFDLAE